MKMITEDIKLLSVVLEMRYRSLVGWDLPGAISQAIEDNIPEWTVLNFNGGTIQAANEHKRMRCSIEADKIIIVQEYVENINQFKKDCSSITNLLVEVFKIKKISRIGNRYQFIKGVHSAEEAVKILSDSEFVTVDIDRIKGFGNKIINNDVKLTVQKEDLKCSIAVKQGRRIIPNNYALKLSDIALEYNPSHSISFDLDFFQENILVRASDFDINAFIHKAYKIAENNLPLLLK